MTRLKNQRPKGSLALQNRTENRHFILRRHSENEDHRLFRHFESVIGKIGSLETVIDIFAFRTTLKGENSDT